VARKVSIPTWDTELYLEYHRGVYTTQANHKHNMRTAEEEVLNAEKWSSLAWLDGQSYPGAQLTVDWEKVLFNQFHDLAAGSGIAVIYRDAQQDYDWVRMSTDEISAGALNTVAEQINTQSGEELGNSAFPEKSVPVVIFNPLGWARRGNVTVTLQLPVHEGRSYNWYRSLVDNNIHTPDALARDPKTGEVTLRLSGVDVPAFGYRVVWVNSGNVVVKDSKAPGTESETPASFVLENGNLRVLVDKATGCITSLFNKRANYETIASGGCGNQLQAFKDTPKEYDAWNIDPGTLDQPPALLSAGASVTAEGATEVRVSHAWQNSKFVQTISLQGDQVDIDNDIDWHESHVLLKAAFPLAVTSDFATYEIPYGTIERPTTRNNSWEKAQFEVPAMRWADLSGAGADGKVHGLSLLNQDKYGYDATGNVLRITLLRSPKWPDPDADMGHHHFHYALYPHAGTWKDALTVRHGWEYNYPLQAVVATAHLGSLPAEHSFASVEPENVVLTAVKKAEDANGLIFRVYEWAGKESTVEFHVPPGAMGATVTNLMEQPEGNPLTVADDVVKVPIHPYEILTVRVDYAKGRE
jgi:alpha-mannosidase